MSAKRKIKIENLYLDDVHEMLDVIDALCLQDRDMINVSVKSSELAGYVADIEFVVDADESTAAAQIAKSEIEDLEVYTDCMTVTIHVTRNK